MAHENEQLIRRGYEAFANGDMETLDEIFADDITWHSPGDNPLAGDFEGKQEVLGVLGKIGEITDSFSQEIHDVLANDDHAVALVKNRATRGGETFESTAVHVYHVENGQVTSFWNHTYDQAKADAFFS
ncbi:MAG: nuclear transport factor 2 family protein [Nitriliruptorales bacterium]|nr:nuclear transport factor 2 family protein [Nitriliruptorales bacterium]